MSDARAADGKADVWQFVAPQLPMHNVREAQAYYRDVLDFKIAWIDDEDDGAVAERRRRDPSWNFDRVRRDRDDDGCGFWAYFGRAYQPGGHDRILGRT